MDASQIEDLGSQLSAMSQLLDRMEMGNRLNTRFDQRRQFNTEFGYLNTITVKDYWSAFRRYSIARRIVTLPAEDTWKEPPEVYESENPRDVTPFEAEWALLSERLKLWHYFERGDIVAGIGHYAAVLIEVAGNGALDQPLKKARPADIVGLCVLDEERARILSLDADVGSPRFNLPDYYSLDLASDTTPTVTARTTPITSKTKKVHWSRVIHIADGLLVDEVYGTPRLEAVFNRLDDMEKVLGGSAESFFQRAANFMAFIVDKDFKPPKDSVITDMDNQIEEFQHRIRRFMRLWGVEPKVIAPEIADPRGVLQGQFSVIAGTTAIPQRLLFGSERGDLASSQDRSNWADRIRRRQLQYAEPVVLRQFIDRMLSLGALPTPATAYKVKWPVAQALSELERSEIAQRRAAAVKSYSQQGSDQFPQKIITADEVREELGWPPLGDAMVDDMDPAAPDDKEEGDDNGDSVD